MNAPETREDGGVLIIALIFVAVMGLVVGALVELAGANFSNTLGSRTQRKVVYSADAAVKEAIEKYSEGFADTTGTGTCLTSPPELNTKPVTVSCSDPITGTSGASSNQPPLAVITLGSGEIGLDTASTGVLNVRGGVYSNTNINAGASSSIHVIGPTTARSGCAIGGSPGRTPPPYQLDPAATNNCSIGTAAYPNGDDPPYLPAVSAAPPAVTPSCPSNGPVTMPAGTYNSLTALNALSTGPCSNRLLYFPPRLGGAVYYFDFTGGGNWTPGTDIVGGTLPAGESLSTVLSLPSGERCDPQKSGVQFIFGGESRITLNSGASVDLCAQHDPTRTRQEIALYGLGAGYPAPTGSPGPPAFHRQSGCVSNVGSGTKCPFVTMSGSGSFFSVAGTVYAPLSKFDIQMTGGATRVFGRGIIARSLAVAVEGSTSCGACSPFSLPPPTAAVETASVVFQASVSNDSNRRLRALVIFYRDGATPNIQSWSVVNESP